MNRTPGEKCAVVTCWKPVKARSWCDMHYHRAKRNGDPLRKLRARGVMDAPICSMGHPPAPSVPRIGPAQLAFARALSSGRTGRAELCETLNITPGTLYVLVSRFRARFEYESVVTVYRHGYRLGVIS